MAEPAVCAAFESLLLPSFDQSVSLRDELDAIREGMLVAIESNGVVTLSVVSSLPARVPPFSAFA